MSAKHRFLFVFALESATDELAVALEADPELRPRNEPELDEFKKLPFSSRSSRKCYRAAAERFGWSRRNPEPPRCAMDSG